MTFRHAVEAAPAPVSGAYRLGKQALERGHREQVLCRNERRFTGSIALDGCLAGEAKYRDAERWDYGIGYQDLDARESAIWIEIHPATTGEVTKVLGKLDWLKEYLRTQAPALAGITAKGHRCFQPYVWLATQSGTHITPTSPQARNLRSAGLDLPRRVLQLP